MPAAIFYKETVIATHGFVAERLILTGERYAYDIIASRSAFQPYMEARSRDKRP